jgi:glycosyltransferase involved in cell wall biosynthesis
MTKERILLVAYQCGPGMGSVSQIGWEWYQRLSQKHSVTLVTHVRNRSALEAAASGAASGAGLNDSEILYIDTEWFAGPLYRLARRIFPKSEHSVFLVSSLDYFVFDYTAYRQLKRGFNNTEGEPRWTLLHRVTPVTLAAPTWLARLGLPTVIGPLNSGLTDPRGFGTIMKQESTWLIRVRGLTRLLDAVIGSSRRASCLLTASQATLNGVARRYHPRCRPMLENGVDLTRFPAAPWPAAPTENIPLRVLFTGRLVPIKGLDMLLTAMSRLKAEGFFAELDVVGDGPMRAEWTQLAERLGLAQHVRFHGALPSDAVAAQMRACHVFCLPSVRESGGAVLLEAMATARPVIGLDFGGPGEIIDAEIGAKLPMHNPEQVITDLVFTLKDVCTRPEAWRQSGLLGRQRVETRYSWPAKIAAAEALYQEILQAESLVPISCNPDP